MTVALKIVSSAELPNPPYPADTRVNGWRFELDVERIKRSDTWVMAEPEWRPWLLMIWMVAWDQRPAGSLPAEHALIAAHIGMDPRMFSAHADILLRGFVPYRDGRLYHPVVVDQVLALLDRREQERERKAKWRDKKADVPRDRHGTDVGKTLQEQEQDKDSVPNGTGASAPDIKTMLWITGERLLGSRPYVGRLIKQHGEPAVFHALAECVSKNPADPRAYIAGLLRANGTGGASAAPRTREQWAAWGQQQRTPAKRGESMDAYVARLQAQYEASHP